MLLAMNRDTPHWSFRPRKTSNSFCPQPRKSGPLIAPFPAFLCVLPGPRHILVIYLGVGGCFFLLRNYRLDEDRDFVLLSSVFTARPVPESGRLHTDLLRERMYGHYMLPENSLLCQAHRTVRSFVANEKPHVSLHITYFSICFLAFWP